MVWVSVALLVALHVFGLTRELDAKAIPPKRAPGQAPVTYSGQVAAILYRHCVDCHRPGEVAPFPLLNYRDAARHAKLIAKVSASRYMPPWQPEPGYGRFADERRLSGAEIALLARWAANGAPEGDPAKTPRPPPFVEGWQGGEPDLIARMPKPFAVAADGPDVYECFVVPLALGRDRYVRAAEFHPGARSAVHHALFLFDSSGAARKRGEAYPCFGWPGFLPSGALGGWSPGARPIRMPEGIATPARRNADLVMQIHYHPTGKPEMDQSTLGLYLTDQPPARHLMDVALGSNRIDIPAGEPAYKVRDHFTIPVDVEATGIIPHAHYVCRDMRGWAILPGGRKQWLLWIRDWNFNRQEQYRYAKSLRLPAGTRVEMEFTYDNSARNPRNPSHPPRRVTWGPDSTDEMAGLHLQVVPEREADLHELGMALWGKVMRMAGGGFYRRE